METYINLDTNSAYITASVRTKRRWLSKFTLRDKVSCISAFVVLLLVVFKSHDGECSRLNGAFASPCYMLDGNNKPILEKPQVSRKYLQSMSSSYLVIRFFILDPKLGFSSLSDTYTVLSFIV